MFYLGGKAGATYETKPPSTGWKTGAVLTISTTKFSWAAQAGFKFSISKSWLTS